MLAFNSQTSENGQYLQYGKEPLFLNVGGATPLWRGISAGLSVRVTLDATAQLDAVSTLGGETSRERLAVNAEPAMKTILGRSEERRVGKECSSRRCPAESVARALG